MKVMVRLAIVLAILLIFTNVAFARSCDIDYCFDVYSTNTAGEVHPEGFWDVCLNNTGPSYLCENGSCWTLYEFQGGPALFSTSLFPLGAGSSNAWLVRGEDVSFFINYFAGFYIAGVAADYEGGRSTIRGMKVDLSNCDNPA